MPRRAMPVAVSLALVAPVCAAVSVRATSARVRQAPWVGGGGAAASASNGARRPRVTAPLRLSTDLLAPEPASPPLAQPETQAEPHLAADPSDPRHVVAAWQEQRYRDGGARSLGYAASFDRGRTWTEGILPGLTVAAGGEWSRGTDPWVAIGPRGQVFFSAMAYNTGRPGSAINVSVSDDGGRTFAAPVTVYSHLRDFNDKQAVAVDGFAGSPHAGTVYVGWLIYEREEVGGPLEGAVQALAVSRSTDGGRTYRRPRIVRRGAVNVGAVPVVGPDGTVYLVWAGMETAAEPFRSIYFCRSRNGGRSWSRPRLLAEIRSRGVADTRTGNALVSLTADPNDGALYLAWADARFSSRDQLALSVSRDGGDSWSKPRRVNDHIAEVFTVTIAVNSRGDVAVSYYGSRDTPWQLNGADVYTQVSSDGGATFGPGIRVTRRSFDLRDGAWANGYFMGDYMGLVGTDRFFHLLFVAPLSPSALDPARLQSDVHTARLR